MSEFFSKYPQALWEVLVDLSPWLIFGLVIAGFMNFLFPKKLVHKWLGHNRQSSVWLAAIMGMPLPLCSCGVVPAALALRRRGASKGATISFIVTTPQSGVDSIMATWGMMGWPFAAARTFFTLITGIFAGLSVQQFCDNDPPTTFSSEEDEENHGPFLIRLLKPGWEILESIYKSLLAGILLAALLSKSMVAFDSIVSPEIIVGFSGMLILALIGLPLYVCGTASIPLGLAFLQQGFSLGAVFVFLLVGPATNAATALIVKKEIGTKAFVIYLMSIFVVGIAAGQMIDWIHLNWEFFRLNMPEHHHHHGSGSILETLSAIILSGGILFLFLRQYIFKKKEVTMSDSSTIKVSGMTCDHCRRSIDKAVSSVEGVSEVNVDLDAGTVQFQGGDEALVKDAIIKAGFETP